MEFTPENLGRFRWMAAGYVKHLIIARWKSEPGFLSQKELVRWELLEITKDQLPSATHLKLAANDLYRINTEFLSRCGSGGLAINESESVFGDLLSAIAFLVPPEGGSPGHNAVLLEMTAMLERRETVDWNSLVDWSQLSIIRGWLDRLPPLEQPSQSDRGEDGVTADGIRLDGRFYLLTPRTHRLARVLCKTEDWSLPFVDAEDKLDKAITPNMAKAWQKEFNRIIAESRWEMSLAEERFTIRISS